MQRRTFVVQTAGSLAGIALLPDRSATGPRWLPEPKAVALVGVGRQGRAIVAELLKIDGAKLVALCDIHPARVKAGLERAAGIEGFQDHRSLLDKRRDLDAVIVATPTHLHPGIVTDALQAGRHVYCEAPLAHTLEDAKAIAAAAQRSNRIFMAGFQGRSNPVYQLARTFARTDAVRSLVSMYAQYHREASWRFPAANAVEDKTANWRLDPEVSLGLAGEVGAQQFDVVQWFKGGRPARITGRGAVLFHQDGRKVPDTVQADLVWPDHATLHFEATLANSFGGQHEVLHGVNGAIKLAWTHGWMFKEADAPTLGWEVYALRQQFHSDEGIILIAEATKLAAQGQLKAGVGLPYSPLYYALGDFLKSVTFPNVPVPCTAADGLRATALGILANRAIVTGETVEVPEF